MNTSENKGLIVIFFAFFCFAVSFAFINTVAVQETLSLFTSNGAVISPKNNQSINSTAFILNGTALYDWGELATNVTFTDTLQSVTDRGSSTTNSIQIKSLNISSDFEIREDSGDLIINPLANYNDFKYNPERNNSNFEIYGIYNPAVPRDSLFKTTDYGVTLLGTEDISDLSLERGVQMGTSLSLWASKPSMDYNHVTHTSIGGAVWQLMKANIYNRVTNTNIKVGEIGILASNSPNTGYMYLGASSNTNYIRNPMRITDTGTIEINPSQVTSAVAEDTWLQVFGNTALDYFAITSTISSASNPNKGDIFIVSKLNNVGIGIANPTEKLQVIGNANVSGTVYTGIIQASDYKSSDGTIGWTGSCTGTIEVKNGLVVGCT